MLQEFRQFALRGNVIDLAVGVVIGGAFGKIVTSLVNDIITPIIGILLRGIDVSTLAFIVGNAKINYGSFLQSIIDFLIIALAIFVAIKQITKVRKKLGLESEPTPETTKECSYCLSKIDKRASRCPQCTSSL